MSTEQTEWLIERLSDPSAFTPPPRDIEIRQTHISIVALVDQVVYKVRKPVHLAFVDFSTLEKRRIDCLDEVRLNRRLANDVYLGVVPIVRTKAGIRVEGEGEPIEWAVKMRRLPDEASLLAKLQSGDVTPALLTSVARRIAEFHAMAAHRSQTTDGGFDAVTTSSLENFEQVAKDVDITVNERVLSSLRTRTEERLKLLRPLIEARTLRGVPCDGHGDLRLEHVYSFPESAAPGDVIVIDCVEFNERLRFADPVSDVAFLAMELVFWDRRDLARSFTEAYFRFSGDEEGRDLLDFYIAYRSIVRAKVRGLELREREIGEDRRTKSLGRAKAHFLLALGVLEPPAMRPALVLMSGLPGTGKSTMARALAEGSGFEVIRSDVVRKELAGVDLDRSAASEWRAGIYTHDFTLRTYAECLRRAEVLLLDGKRVIVDASFGADDQRKAFLRAATGLCIPAVWFVCQASPECVRDRISKRTGDASDADLAVYEQARQAWEAAGTESQPALVEIDTERGAPAALDHAVSALTRHELL